MINRKLLATSFLVVVSAAASLFALADAINAPPGADPFGGWGGVLSSTPLTAVLVYLFREVMAANRLREVDVANRQAAVDAHELKRDEIFAARDKDMAKALSELAVSIRTLNLTCRGRNDIGIVSQGQRA